jgi:hypothetical protein
MLLNERKGFSTLPFAGCIADLPMLRILQPFSVWLNHTHDEYVPFRPKGSLDCSHMHGVLRDSMSPQPAVRTRLRALHAYASSVGGLSRSHCRVGPRRALCSSSRARSERYRGGDKNGRSQSSCSGGVRGSRNRGSMRPRTRRLGSPSDRVPSPYRRTHYRGDGRSR